MRRAFPTSDSLERFHVYHDERMFPNEGYLCRIFTPPTSLRGVISMARWRDWLPCSPVRSVCFYCCRRRFWHGAKKDASFVCDVNPHAFMQNTCYHLDHLMACDPDEQLVLTAYHGLPEFFRRSYRLQRSFDEVCDL